MLKFHLTIAPHAGPGARGFTVLLAQADAEGDLDWGVAVDSTIVESKKTGTCVTDQ
ncbi:hypothetical protein [Streptomyces sioyaensis]|uniref:hypothetical protein n=1 Tax=Streptomyces sioyaensis TaxID=67364 RepID=UPI003D74D2C1